MMKTKKLKIQFGVENRLVSPALRIIRRPRPEVAEAEPSPARGTISLGSKLAGIFARLKMAGEIPFGYEDASGFHTGDEPADLDSLRRQF